MLSDNRKARIIDLLNQKSFVTVSELSKEFKISEVSVRKMLTSLEKNGVLKRSWGGAVPVSNTLKEFSHKEKEKLHLDEKKAIARVAYNEINDGEAIFMDSGTTTMELAKLLASGNKHNVFVVTHAINIAAVFQDSPIKVFVVGGSLRNEILCCISNISVETVKRFTFDRVFVTGNHFSLERGYTTPVVIEASFKASLFECGNTTYVLMDYSKFGVNSLCQIAPLSKADIVITDYNAPKELEEDFARENVKLIRAM